jgi:hypothetical protein
MDAHVDEQRRIKAEARVSCSLPSFLWTSIRKNGRLKAKETLTASRSSLKLNLNLGKQQKATRREAK